MNRYTFYLIKMDLVTCWYLSVQRFSLVFGEEFRKREGFKAVRRLFYLRPNTISISMKLPHRNSPSPTHVYGSIGCHIADCLLAIMTHLLSGASSPCVALSLFMSYDDVEIVARWTRMDFLFTPLAHLRYSPPLFTHPSHLSLSSIDLTRCCTTRLSPPWLSKCSSTLLAVTTRV